MLYFVELNDKQYGVELTDDTAVVNKTSEKDVNHSMDTQNEEEFEVEDIPDLFTDDEEENINNILATMPGTVILILVKEGEDVEEGQLLAVYESMKMENEVLSPRKTKIQKVYIKEGDKIEIGQNLITFSGE